MTDVQKTPSSSRIPNPDRSRLGDTLEHGRASARAADTAAPTRAAASTPAGVPDVDASLLSSAPGAVRDTFDGNRARPGDPAEVTRAVSGLLAGPVLTDDAAITAVQHLSTLASDDVARVWRGLGPDDRAHFLDNVDGPARRVLVDTLVRGGVVAPAPTASVDEAARAFGKPPAAPRLVQNTPDLEPALRGALHDENMARATAYNAAYSDYVDAFKETAWGCDNDIARLRDLGPLCPSLLPNKEPGTMASKECIAYASDWMSTSTTKDLETLRTLAAEVSRATGRPLPGMLTIGARVTVATPAVSVTVGAEMDGDGRSRAVGGFAAGRGGMKVTGDGTYDRWAADGSRFTGKVGIEREEKPKGAGGKSPDGFDHIVPDDTTGSGSISGSTESGIAVGGKVNLGGALVGGGFDTNGVVNASLGAGYKAGDVEVSAEVYAQAKVFTSVDDIRIDEKDEGFYAIPRELTAGVRWDALPEKRRDYLESRHGWTRKEWVERQDLRVPVMVR